MGYQNVLKNCWFDPEIPLTAGRVVEGAGQVTSAEKLTISLKTTGIYWPHPRATGKMGPSQGGAPGGCEQSASPPSLPGNPLSSGGRSAAPSPEVPAVVRGGRLWAQPPAPPCRPRLPHCPRSPGSGPATRAGVAATGGPSALLRPRAQQQQVGQPRRDRALRLARPDESRLPARLRAALLWRSAVVVRILL